MYQWTLVNEEYRALSQWEIHSKGEIIQVKFFFMDQTQRGFVLSYYTSAVFAKDLDCAFDDSGEVRV